MVKSVNKEVLSQKDYLSTNVYHYNKSSHELRACFDRYGKIIDYEKEKLQYEHTQKHAR